MTAATSVPPPAAALIRPPSAAQLFEAALATAGRTPLTLRTRTWSRRLPLARWCGQADQADVAVLDRYVSQLPTGARVMDLGCGPGRHAEQLRREELQVLGVDASRTAAAMARRRGVDVVCADALGPLPGGGHFWDGVILLDGNIGIGGDPLLLLCRIRDLLVPHGRVLVELDTSGSSDRCTAVLDDGEHVSAGFPWARLSHGSALAAAACAADLRLTDSWTHDGTDFAVLRPGRWGR
jgi:SAM-dependent methyltransferase